MSSTECDVVVCFKDYPSQQPQKFLPSSKVMVTTGATAIDICDAPENATVREVDFISFRNNDSASVTVTFRYVEVSTNYKLAAFTLATLEALFFTADKGWQCMDASGNLKNVIAGNIAATDLTVSGNLTVNGNTTLGDASGDTLTIRPNAVTWSNNPTHSGAHTFSGLMTTQAGITNSGAALTSSAILRVTGNTALPAAGGSGVFWDYASSVSRAYIGDGSGFSFAYAKRSASVTTDLVTISDAGSVSVGGVAASASTALIAPAGTTAISSLRVPHGAAPTAPVNGDIWTTTAGLFVRVNGATVGPLS